MAKILLIDDDAQVLEVMTSFLEREKYEISTATDGKQGINRLTAPHIPVQLINRDRGNCIQGDAPHMLLTLAAFFGTFDAHTRGEH
jgi:CheY-like chemotaxis protein